jgi:hypothetical protein
LESGTIFVRFEVPIALSIKIIVFWGVTRCSCTTVSEELAATIFRIKEYTEEVSSNFLRKVVTSPLNYTVSIPEDGILQ